MKRSLAEVDLNKVVAEAGEIKLKSFAFWLAL